VFRDAAEKLRPIQQTVLVWWRCWFRVTFPRFRYDQLMDIGWKIAIPVGMAAVLINAVLGMVRHPRCRCQRGPWPLTP